MNKFTKFDRNDAFWRVWNARQGFLEEPRVTEEYLVELRRHLIDWIDRVNEEIASIKPEEIL